MNSAWRVAWQKCDKSPIHVREILWVASRDTNQQLVAFFNEFSVFCYCQCFADNANATGFAENFWKHIEHIKDGKGCEPFAWMPFSEMHCRRSTPWILSSSDVFLREIISSTVKMAAESKSSSTNSSPPTGCIKRLIAMRIILQLPFVYRMRKLATSRANIKCAREPSSFSMSAAVRSFEMLINRCTKGHYHVSELRASILDRENKTKSLQKDFRLRKRPLPWVYFFYVRQYYHPIFQEFPSMSSAFLICNK